MRHEGRTIVVTGAGSGIGRRIAVAAAAEGAHVGLLDVSSDGLGGTAALIAEGGAGSCDQHPVDVASTVEVDRVIAATAATTGRIDGLVNAAAILVEGSTTEISELQLDWAIEVNLKGPWRTIRAAAPHLSASRSGAVVNIASIEGLAAAPNHLAYSVTKAGMLGLSRSVALDLGPDVRCNTICPGTILTPMSEGFLDALEDPSTARQQLADKTLVGRLGQPDDIAQATLFLLSPESAFINGTTLVIDGGRMSRVP